MSSDTESRPRMIAAFCFARMLAELSVRLIGILLNEVKLLALKLPVMSTAVFLREGHEEVLASTCHGDLVALRNDCAFLEVQLVRWFRSLSDLCSCRSCD